MKSGSAGFTVMELLVAVAMIGVMVMLAAPRVNRKSMSLSLASEEFQGNLRTARANAMRRGAHFRVTITGTQTYTLQRMSDPDGDGLWTVDATYPTQTVTIPPSVSIGAAAVSQKIEFNTRGMLNGTVAGVAPTVVYIPLTVTGGSTKTIEIWPSGQVEES